MRSPETSRAQEIETKIPELGSLSNFKKNLELSRAVEIIPERKIVDETYVADENNDDSKEKRRFFFHKDSISEEHWDEFVLAVNALGLKVEDSEQPGTVVIKGKLTTKKVNVRLRRDGKKTVFTVKSGKKVDKGIKSTDEYEPEVNIPQDIENMFRQIGLVRERHSEKKRTTWQIIYDGVPVKVELNVSPSEKVKPWVEVEASSPDLVIKVAQLIGYNKKDFFEKGDKSLYKKYGLESSEINNLRFELNDN